MLSPSPSSSTSESVSISQRIHEEKEEDTGAISASPEPVFVKPPPRNQSLASGVISGLPITEEDDWVTLPPATPHTGLPKTPPNNRRHSLDSRSRDPTPSPPPKSFRNSLTHGLKRLSLNSSISRSPSIGGRRSLSHSRNGSTSSTLPPLPNDAVLIQPHAHKRIRDPSPPALYCHEVYATKSASERCMIYAKKINELYLYDCGLADWVLEAKIHGPSSTVSIMSASETQRKISHGSTMSEVTFPRRPDASLATDLTVRDPVDVTPPRGPPVLPYPSLANQRANPPPKPNSSGSFASLLSGGGHGSGSNSPSKQAPSKGGFFATLSRKTSVNRRDRGGGSGSSSGGARLTKPPPASAPATVSPISVNKSLASVVGGPRAPPNRASRAFTSGSVSDSPSGTGSSRASTTLAKRPSLYNIPSESAAQVQHRSQQHEDPAFIAQVNKLADLLPHVERDILAGYLRRAGQDVLAIGQYLDDEKNGCVRRD
ncbi:hypothetical protein Moror_1369 [Moniliophthora roreri MCA 2997]|uniref:Uncharacterized protein n=1 Tax=Moniliophthora roreri (strain MCA 2997) TaxID=1381753 RepID=V2WRN8_MONRO|nr:hypothetical protein Moror_1369 [Moniliophthora roreri MCA 2997]